MYMIVGLDVNAMAEAGMGEFINPVELGNGIRNGMYMLVTLIPAICLLLCCIPIFFYKLTGKTKDDMLTALAEARKERGVKIEEGEDEPEVFTEEFIEEEAETEKENNKENRN